MTDTAHARSTDPGTSHDAAASVRHIRESQELILHTFRRCGPMHDRCLTNLLRHTGMSESGIRSRRAELVAKDLVRNSGQTVRLQTGRLSIVWEACP